MPIPIAPPGGSPLSLGGQSGPGSYLTYARKGYQNNEIVFSAIELLATSAAEPHIIGRRWRRNRREIQAAAKMLQAAGIVNRAGARRIDALLTHNGFYEETPDHPLVRILNKPNPYMSRGQFWSTLVMDYHLAGNAYVLKARYPEGSLFRGAVGELWRLRPDRVRIIPSRTDYIEAFEYKVGGEVVRFPREDVLHFKTRNPLDDYYGMPPLMVLSSRIDIDNYMRQFLRTFFERGGTGPGAILSTKQKMTQDDKNEARERLTRLLGGGSYVTALILDNTDGTTYEQMGLNRGLRDALPKELDAVSEARTAMVFGIPGSILGLLIGYESSSYANKRQDWQVLWDVKMTPMLSDFDDVLNLGLVPEFGGIDEVLFDLSDIRALQEDEDKLQDRARKNVTARIWTLEEGRARTGMGTAAADEHFLLPDGSAVKVSELDVKPEEPELTAPEMLLARAIRMMLPERTATGRPRVEDDEEARDLYVQAMTLRQGNPNMTWEVIAARLGVAERTLRRYRDAFEEGD